MKKVSGHHALHWCCILLGLVSHSQSYAQSPTVADCRSEIENVDRKDKSGPLSIYQLPDEKFLLELGSDAFASEFIYSNYVDRGIAPYVGQYAEPRLISFRLNGDTIDVIENDNVGFFADDGPISRTQALTMTDSVIASLKLHTCQADNTYFAYIDQSALSSLSSEFLKSFRGTTQSAANIKGWKSYSDNINFISEHRMTSMRRSSYRSPGAIFSLQIRHIFIERPKAGFHTRRQDSRVGYFTVQRKNLTDISQSFPSVFIHRWRLEKEDPDKPVSKPIKPIVFWIENTTPVNFRPYIRDGVLAWNEALLAAGFSDAIEVYQQPDDADWEAGDISKNVIRWQVANNPGANFGFAPSVHDPVTGEILGADILLNYAGIGDYLDDWTRLSAVDSLAFQDPVASPSFDGKTSLEPSRQEKVSNPILAKPDEPILHIEGSYILAALLENNQENWESGKPTTDIEKITSLSESQSHQEHIVKTEINEILGTETAPASASKDLGERLVKEIFTELTMHEVGHALGLSHNFSGSHWRTMDEIFDREKTKGVVSASVMDYLPINFAPVGMKQGDFTNTRLGPYDIWAIEFGYRPDFKDGERDALLERSKEPEYSYSDNVYGGSPNTLLYDLTNAPMDYAISRIDLASEVSRLASTSEIFEDQRQYLSLYRELQYQISLGMETIASQARPGLSSNNKAEQKKAIKALGELVFSDNASVTPNALIERLKDSQYFAFADKLRIKRAIIGSLMYEQSLLFRHFSNDDYTPTELLFDLKNAVFGADLYPLGQPTKDRRDQQIIFAHSLAALVSDPSEGTNPRTRALMFDRSIISAAALPIRNALMRELWLPTPWAPQEVRAHRQQLRAILQ